jgi:hypothetical protein
VSVVIVSGFQRCGSSLVMQMLAAGGMPIFHDPSMGYPAFETQINMRGGPLDAYDGRALKWLEPLHLMPEKSGVEIQTIWMTRDHLQQAKSAVKFMTHVMGMRVRTSTTRKIMRSYDRDEAASIRAWERRGLVLIVDFETVLRMPASVASTVAQFIGRELDIAAMVGQVKARDASCLPYLLEAELVGAA